MVLRNKPRLIKFRNFGIYVFESRHSANFVMEKENRDFHKLAFIIKGSGFVETDSSQIKLHENQLIQIPPNLSHRIKDDRGNPMTLVMSCFYENVFAGNFIAKEAFSHFQKTFRTLTPFTLDDTFLQAEIMNKYRKMLFEQIHRKPNSNALIWCQLMELLVFLTRIYEESVMKQSQDKNSSAFAGSLSYLDNNFYREIRVEQLAKMAHMSYRRFTDNFKQATGKTLTEYVAELRIEYAKKLLLETENVLYSALEAGFSDTSNFYRVFKKITKLSPKKFILQNYKSNV